MSNGSTKAKERKYRIIETIRKVGPMNVLKIGGGSIGVVAIAAAVFPFLGAIVLCGLGIGCLAIMGTLLYSYAFLLKCGIVKPVDNVVQKGESPASRPREAIEYKLWDSRNEIFVFTNEPSVTQIIRIRSEDACSSEIGFTVENNSRVIILSDPGRQAVQVIISSGVGKGKVGWICRSHLIADKPKAACA